MPLIITSFISGVLTILAPCVLPVLPVILGSTSVSTDRKRPVIVIASFAASVYLFSVILKASTVLIEIPPEFWKGVTAVILIVFGLITLFPLIWEKISLKLGLQSKSDHLLVSSQQRQSTLGAVLVGASLGPVFSSCSPTYSLILATIFPVSLVQGSLYLLAYIAGLVVMLALVAICGRSLTSRIRWMSDPYGTFHKVLGVVFILLGVMIYTGFDKRIQTWIFDIGYLDITKVEQMLIPEQTSRSISGTGGQSQTDGSPDMLLDGRTIAAPELVGITEWINVDGKPPSLADLRGKVVIIDFWTYSCINCQRTLPYLKSWDSKYRDKGLVILGIHAPEFAFERLSANVTQAVEDADIQYPVGLDNDFATWRAYSNQYWPAKYFVDRQGNLRHYHFGEGAYEESERIIQYLLGEQGPLVDVPLTQEESASYRRDMTHETYLGYARHKYFAQTSTLLKDGVQTYTLPPSIRPDEWGIGGQWKIEDERATSMSDGAKLSLRFSAKEVYLVMDASSPQSVAITINGSEHKKVTVNKPTLYTVVSLPDYATDQLLEITFPAGVSAHAFTFGSKEL